MQLGERSLEMRRCISISLELRGLKKISANPQSTSDTFCPGFVSDDFSISSDP